MDFVLNSADKHKDELEILQRNDEQTFALLYKRYWHPLLKFASRSLDDKDTCAELVQELFVRLHAQRLPLTIKSSVSSYLFVALRNRIFNHLRNKALRKKHLAQAARQAAWSQNSVEQFIDMRALQGEISDCLYQMPVKYREVYMLRDQKQVTIKTMSYLLNRPVDTVEKQLRKATTMMRDNLKAYLNN